MNNTKQGQEKSNACIDPSSQNFDPWRLQNQNLADQRGKAEFLNKHDLDTYPGHDDHQPKDQRQGHQHARKDQAPLRSEDDLAIPISQKKKKLTEMDYVFNWGHQEPMRIDYIQNSNARVSKKINKAPQSLLSEAHDNYRKIEQTNLNNWHQTTIRDERNIDEMDLMVRYLDNNEIDQFKMKLYEQVMIQEKEHRNQSIYDESNLLKDDESKQMKPSKKELKSKKHQVVKGKYHPDQIKWDQLIKLIKDLENCTAAGKASYQPNKEELVVKIMERQPKADFNQLYHLQYEELRRICVKVEDLEIKELKDKYKHLGPDQQTELSVPKVLLERKFKQRSKLLTPLQQIKEKIEQKLLELGLISLTRDDLDKKYSDRMDPNNTESQGQDLTNTQRSKGGQRVQIQNDDGQEEGQDYQSSHQNQLTAEEKRTIDLKLKELKLSSRLLPDSAITTYFGKPAFHAYGNGNTNPSVGGLCYGQFMRTHNINPQSGDNKPEYAQVYKRAMVKPVVKQKSNSVSPKRKGANKDQTTGRSSIKRPQSGRRGATIKQQSQQTKRYPQPPKTSKVKEVNLQKHANDDGTLKSAIMPEKFKKQTGIEIEKPSFKTGYPEIQKDIDEKAERLAFQKLEREKRKKINDQKNEKMQINHYGQSTNRSKVSNSLYRQSQGRSDSARKQGNMFYDKRQDGGSAAKSLHSNKQSTHQSENESAIHNQSLQKLDVPNNLQQNRQEDSVIQDQASNKVDGQSVVDVVTIPFCPAHQGDNMKDTNHDIATSNDFLHLLDPKNYKYLPPVYTKMITQAGKKTVKSQEDDVRFLIAGSQSYKKDEKRARDPLANLITGSQNRCV